MVADIRAACDEHGALLILDEVQTGMGRTGTLWAYERYDLRPDVMTLAKGLGGGLPIGALVTTPEHADVFAPGDHGSTFAGNPLVSAAANAALDVLDDPALLAHVDEMGALLTEGLRGLPRRDRGARAGADARRRGRLRRAGVRASARWRSRRWCSTPPARAPCASSRRSS